MKTKRLFAFLFLILLPAALFTGCGSTWGMQRDIGTSDRYSPAQLEAAMDVVARHFRRHFDGCTLTELRYDEAFSDRYAAEWAQQYDAKNAIVLLSSFDVGPTSDGSLTPNQTYTRWQWILTSDIPGIWTLQTWGYG